MRFMTRALTFSMLFLLTTAAARALGPLLKARNPAKAVERRAAKTPDVFVIVLDKYSSGKWMSYAYGVDQDPFEDSLRALGFVVPAKARANYAHTEIALASFLNWQYLTPANRKEARSSEEMRRLVSEARIWDTFRKRGYRVFVFPTTFVVTREFENADVQLRWPTSTASPFAATWVLNSPLAALASERCEESPCPKMGRMPYPIETVDELKWQLRTLASLPDSAGPVLGFLHLLSPHEPYLFKADCSPRQPWWPVNDQGENYVLIGKAYGDQVRCIDRLVLATVRTLIQHSRIPPVIILQADHGHGRITTDPVRGFTLTARQLSLSQLGERLGVFAAYRFPGADTSVYRDISPVNVIPLVLSRLFGGKPTLLADHSYWSTYQDPFSFAEIPSRLTYPPNIGDTGR